MDDDNILYFPDISRPGREALVRDSEGRYFQVFHQEQLVAVCDSRVKYTPDFSDEPFLAAQNITDDCTTPEGVVNYLLSLIGTGGALADFEGSDLTIWKGHSLHAVIHHGRNVHLSRIAEHNLYDDQANIVERGEDKKDRAQVIYIDPSRPQVMWLDPNLLTDPHAEGEDEDNPTGL